MITHTRSPYREVVTTAAALGTRLDETLGVAWRNVDFKNALIEIEQQTNSKREIAKLKTQTAYRRIDAPGWLMGTLAEIKLGSELCGPDDLVFATRTGKPISHGNVLSRGVYRGATTRASSRVSFHSLGHTHASLWIKDGGDVITLSKRLGHGSPQITMSVSPTRSKRPTITPSARPG